MKKKLNNPFILSGYYGSEYFCDRETEVQQIHDNITNERNLVIYSWRRLGKTALIHRYLSEFDSNKKNDSLYVDLLATRNIEEAIQQIAEAVYEKYGNSKSGLNQALFKLLGSLGIQIGIDSMSGLPSLNFQYQPKRNLLKSLKDIGEFLVQKNENIIIAIDEFQQITSYENKNAEAIFRNWVQSFPQIRFIFSGSHRNLMSAMFVEKNRPFFRSAQLLQLNPIELSKYQEFITKHFTKAKKIINPEQIDYIYDWSRKQTYTIQLICNKLYGQTSKVTQEEIQQAIHDIIKQEENVYANYTKLLSNMQWKLLTAIAKEEIVFRPTSKDFIAQYGLGATSSVSTALQSLIKNEIIIKDDDGYKIHDVLLSRWVQQL
jgi:hypothetical protein